MKEFNHKIIVTKDTIDENNHVNNVIYVKWMQDVANMHSLAVGDTLDMQKQNSYIWVAKSHNIEYIRSAYEGDEVHIKTWVEEYKKSACLRHYEFSNQKNEILTKAQTIYVYLDATSLRPKKIPQDLANRYK